MRSPLDVYGIVACLVILAAIARWLLHDTWFGSELPFFTFYFAVIVAAWIGGFRPALIATIAGFVLSLHFFIDPHQSFQLIDETSTAGLVIYMLLGLAISGLGEAKRRAQIRAAHLEQENQGEILRDTFASSSSNGRSAQALLSSEQRYQTLFQSIEEGCTVLERIGGDTNTPLDYCHVVANPAYTALSRLPDVVGKTLVQTFPSEAHTWIAIFERVYHSGEPVRFDHVFRDEQRTLEFSTFIVENNSQRYIGVIMKDTTERKMAQERERQLLVEAATANAHFRAFFEQGALFAVIMDLDGMVIEPNRLSLEAYGYNRDQIVGKRFWECPWWNRSSELMQVVEQASAEAARGKSFRRELAVSMADGNERVLDLIILPIKDADDRVMFLAPTGTDITERKHAEAQLADAHQFLHSSLDALSSHIAVLDEQGVILAVNDAWRKFADENNYEGHNYGVGSNYLEECAPSTGDCLEGSQVAEGLCAVLTGKAEFYELEYPCHSATENRWFVMRVTRFKSPGPVRVVVSHENVTLRKLAEQALKESNERKDAFLATLAHELRNPLAPLQSGLEIIKLANGDMHSRNQARAMMERQLGQMVRLIDDLLDLSRISRGKITLRKDQIDLGSVVEQAVETTMPLIDASQHELSVVKPEQPLYVNADITRLAQVFSNLLNNAVKYTVQGGQIKISIESQGELGEQLESWW